LSTGPKHTYGHNVHTIKNVTELIHKTYLPLVKISSSTGLLAL